MSLINKFKFTLIEMLLVIVVLAILASILLPSLLRAREYARQSYCMNNMRQIGLAFKTYVEDNDGFMPPQWFWLTDLSPAYQYAKDLDVFICPSSGTEKLSSEEDLYQRTEEEAEANMDKVDYYCGGLMKDIELSNSIANNGGGNNAYKFDMSNPSPLTQAVVDAKIDSRMLYEKKFNSHLGTFNVIYIKDLHYEISTSGFTEYWTLDDRGYIETSLDPYPEY
jgi:prepilin-type N-terminal cleavage/methylation domain-containing protein